LGPAGDRSFSMAERTPWKNLVPNPKGLPFIVGAIRQESS